jgi:hypothetical protein
VTCRIINGDGVSRDCSRVQINFDSSRTYFWKFTWRTGQSKLEVRRDSETGSVVYSSTINTGSHPYRPEQHYVYLGAPGGRAGAMDATLPGGTYSKVYVGPGPRPPF